MHIIGGMFGLEQNLTQFRNVEPFFLNEPRQLFLSARCAIQFLIKHLNPPQVWMPSYLCCSMLEAVDKESYHLNFFPIGSDLKVTSLEWLERIIPGSLIVLIDYFGFPCQTDLITEVQARGSFVLEDACQALLSKHVGRQSDFVLFSPRKTVGVPDGGILQYKRHQGPSIELIPPPNKWWLKAFEASISRREFDKFGSGRGWFDLFRDVEATYPLGQYSMSELSIILLKESFDYQFIAKTRRENFTCLAQRLSKYAMFHILEEETTPLGFPIRVENRDEIRQFLFDHGIYPPIHWEICGCVPSTFADSHQLSQQIMTLPCDQRLNINDMIRISDLIQEVSGTN